MTSLPGDAGDAAEVLASLARRIEDHETHAALNRARMESAIGRLVHCLQYERGVTVLHAATDGARMGHERTTAQKESLASEQSLVEVIAGLEPLALAECTGAADALHSMAIAISTLRAARGVNNPSNPEARASTCFTAWTAAIGHLLHAVRLLGGVDPDPDQADRTLARYLVVCSKELAGRERVLGTLRRLDPEEATTALDCETTELSRLQNDYLSRLPELLTGPDADLWRRASADAVHTEIEALRSADGLSDWRGWFNTTTRRIDVLRTLELALLEGRESKPLAKNGVSMERPASPTHHTTALPPDVLIDVAALTEASQGHRAALLSPDAAAIISGHVHRIDALEAELNALKALVDERDTINEAVRLLAKHRRLDDREAHQLLRRMAMNERRSLSDMAQRVAALFTRH